MITVPQQSRRAVGQGRGIHIAVCHRSRSLLLHQEEQDLGQQINKETKNKYPNKHAQREEKTFGKDHNVRDTLLRIGDCISLLIAYWWNW